MIFQILGIFRMLNNGNNLPKDIFRKIIERVYIQPDDKGVMKYLFMQSHWNKLNWIYQGKFKCFLHAWIFFLSSRTLIEWLTHCTSSWTQRTRVIKSALILIQQMLDYEINAIYTICMFIQVVVQVCCSSS